MMENFEYYNPVRIVFGKKTIARLTDLVPSDKKVLLTYGGGSIKKNGVYDQVVEALKDRAVLEFGGIEPNPTYETCMKAVRLACGEDIGFLLAVGGGSVIDGTKFIAAAVKYKGADPWEIVHNEGKSLSNALPIGCVLTLPASGSEMNYNAVISRTATREKHYFRSHCVFPVFAVLDPETTYSLPLKQICNGIVDSFVHVMEQYVTYDVNTPLQDRQAEAIVKTLIEITPELKTGKKSYQARANLMWCSCQALNGLIACGVVTDWSSHFIGHRLTAFFGLDHARSLSMILPAIWKHQINNKAIKLAKLAQNVWGIDQGDMLEKANSAILKTEEYFKSLNMPTRFGECGIKEADVEKVVESFSRQDVVIGENKNISTKEISEILHLCL